MAYSFEVNYASVVCKVFAIKCAFCIVFVVEWIRANLPERVFYLCEDNVGNGFGAFVTSVSRVNQRNSREVTIYKGLMDMCRITNALIVMFSNSSWSTSGRTRIRPSIRRNYAFPF